MRPIVYNPKGPAREYGKYAVNLFRGCTARCKYCYSPAVMRMSRENFHASVTTAPDVLERLQADMKRIGKVDEPIFLCFTCDPYCVDSPPLVARGAIDIIISEGNTVNILTKGGTKAIKDFGVLERSGSMIGATLTFLDDSLSLKWEPKAVLPGERIHMLRSAKDSDIKTWASIEPVIIPSESLAIMEMAIPYVDEFKIGKLNHHPLAKEIDWKRFGNDAIELLEKHGKKHIIKEDLAKHL